MCLPLDHFNHLVFGCADPDFDNENYPTVILRHFSILRVWDAPILVRWKSCEVSNLQAREALPRAVKLRYRVAPVTKQAVKGVF